MAGQTPKSVAAFANLKRICEEHLAGEYQIEVIDLLENPQLARRPDLRHPTLVRKLPEPMRKIIGDLSNTERVWWACSSALAVAGDEAAAVKVMSDGSRGSR